MKEDSKKAGRLFRCQSTSSISLDRHIRNALYDAVAAAACRVGVAAGIAAALEEPGVDDGSRRLVDPRKLILKLAPIFRCPWLAVEA